MSDDLSAEELLRRYAAGERSFTGVAIAERSNLSGAVLEGVTFEHGHFSDIDARGANLRSSVFRNMNLKCTDFRGADLSHSVFDNVSICAASFKGAKTTNAVFKDVDWYGRKIEEFHPDDFE
jgi:uncharacterized protein YjbI with pentapeptide repeats